MTVRDLIDALEEHAEFAPAGDDTEVRIMGQESWPFENCIHGTCARSDIGREDGEHEDDREQLLEPGETEAIFIVEGRQLCYGSKAAWDAAR